MRGPDNLSRQDQASQVTRGNLILNGPALSAYLPQLLDIVASGLSQKLASLLLHGFGGLKTLQLYRRHLSLAVTLRNYQPEVNPCLLHKEASV